MKEPKDKRFSIDGNLVPHLKKAYISPSLVEYGSIAKLTQSGAGTGTDGGVVADMMMVCI